MLRHGATPLVVSVVMAHILIHVTDRLVGMRGSLLAAIRADYFGGASFGAIPGVSSMIVMFGTIVRPLVSPASWRIAPVRTSPGPRYSPRSPLRGDGIRADSKAGSTLTRSREL